MGAPTRSGRIKIKMRMKMEKHPGDGRWKIGDGGIKMKKFVMGNSNGKLILPRFQEEIGDAGKFALVFGDHGQIQAEGLAGQEKVVWPDAAALAFQLATDRGGEAGGFLVERNQDQGGKKELHPGAFLAG